MHGFVSVIPRLRWQDFLDILIVAYVIYRIALLIRGTRTMQMVIGLGVVAAAFMGSQMLGLFTLNWLLNNFLGSLIVILVVIFQADIRRALTGVGARPLFGARPSVARRGPGAGHHRGMVVGKTDRCVDRDRTGCWPAGFRADRPSDRWDRISRSCSRPSSCEVRRCTTVQS